MKFAPNVDYCCRVHIAEGEELDFSANLKGYLIGLILYL